MDTGQRKSAPPTAVPAHHWQAASTSACFSLLPAAHNTPRRTTTTIQNAHCSDAPARTHVPASATTGPAAAAAPRTCPRASCPSRDPPPRPMPAQAPAPGCQLPGNSLAGSASLPCQAHTPHTDIGWVPCCPRLRLKCVHQPRPPHTAPCCAFMFSLACCSSSCTSPARADKQQQAERRGCGG